MSETQAGSCCYRISYRYQTVLMWDVQYQIRMPIMKGVQIRGAGKVYFSPCTNSFGALKAGSGIGKRTSVISLFHFKQLFLNTFAFRNNQLP